MRHLIIYTHPNENSLNHHLLNTLVETLESQNQEIVVRDLYATGLILYFLCLICRGSAWEKYLKI